MLWVQPKLSSHKWSTYEEDDMCLLFTSGRIQMKPLMIEDEAQDGQV